MRCFQCDEDATQECPRCGALYCDDHGDALCARCMDPALALPSYRVYRGSLLALLVGSIVAVWLLVLPPASADQDGPPDSIAGLVNPEVTATSEATPPLDGTPAERDNEGERGEGAEDPEGEGGEGAEPTPTGTPAGENPEETGTPTPTPTPTPEPEQRYVVQAGDTMLSIAGQFAPAGTDASAFAEQIAQANGITDLSSLQVGQELVIPNG